jgi:hypothetical protein
MLEWVNGQARQACTVHTVLAHVLGLQDGVFSPELFSNHRHRRPGSTWFSVVDVLAVVAKTGLRLGERR